MTRKDSDADAKRRRRGTIRVPSDEVPRNRKTQPMPTIVTENGASATDPERKTSPMNIPDTVETELDPELLEAMQRPDTDEELPITEDVPQGFEDVGAADPSRTESISEAVRVAVETEREESGPIVAISTEESGPLVTEALPRTVAEGLAEPEILASATAKSTSEGTGNVESSSAVASGKKRTKKFARAETVQLSDEDLLEATAQEAAKAKVIPVAIEEQQENAAEQEVRPPTPPPAAKDAPPKPPVGMNGESVVPRRGKAWFEEIFDEDYLRTLPFLTPQATQKEANFLVDALQLEPGRQVLDLGCGYGRHVMELAAQGISCVGLDLSLSLLIRGADEAQRRGLTINFVHGDMRELTFDSQFDAAYCVFSSFGYFDDEANQQVVRNVARALKPGGRFVVEILNRDYVVSDMPSRVWWEGDGCVVLEEVDFNFYTSRLVSNRSVVFEDGRQLEQEISMRIYSLHELGQVLLSGGFRVLEVSGSLATRGRFFGAQSQNLILVAEKATDAPRAQTYMGVG